MTFEKTFDWLIAQWDWAVYRLARHSLRRLCARRPDLAYLLELWIREWRARHALSARRMRETEAYVAGCAGERPGSLRSLKSFKDTKEKDAKDQ